MTIFSPDTDYALGWMVLHSIWQFTLIAVLAGILLFVLRHSRAQFRYQVSNAALLGCLLCALGTFTWYSSHYDLNKKAVMETLAEFKADTLAKPLDAQPSVLQVRPDWALPREKEKDLPATMRDYFELHLPLVLMLWLMGLAVFMFRLFGGISYAYYLRQRMNFTPDPYWIELFEGLCQKAGLRKKVQLLESALVRSPLTIGFVKPLILFPIGMINRLSEQEVEAILAHELAHIMRHDYLFNILQSLMEALFYYHPAVWWLSAQVRNEREHACDDRAIALTGNKLNYAKALVMMQEMAFMPLSPSLGFAGTHKSQLRSRVLRLFSQPTFTFNAMEKWITTALVVCSLMVLAFGQRFHSFTQHYTGTKTEAFAPPRSGVWEADVKGDSIYLSISQRHHGGHWTNGDVYHISAFIGLNPQTTEETTFRLERPAGIMTFKGKFDQDGGYGRFEFVANEAFKKSLEQNNIQDVDEDLMLHCFFADFKPDYLDFLKKKGFKNIDKDELTQLAVFRLDEKAVTQYLSLSEKMGRKNMDLDGLVQLRVANVSTAQIEAYAKAGYKDMDLEMVSNFSLHNVEPEFIREMNEAGFGTLDSDNMLNAKIHGITPEYVQECKRMDLGNLEFDDIVSMKIHHITPDFVAECRAAYGKLDLDEILSIKIHQITPSFFQQCKDMGFADLDLDQAMTIKIHNITPEFVKECRTAGFGDLDLDQIMAIRIHNITPEFVRECKSLGLGNLELDDIMSLKIHNMQTDFVKNLRDAGFKDLNADDVISAKIHDITPKYIREAAEKGFKSPYLEDYINMKVRGDNWRRRSE